MYILVRRDTTERQCDCREDGCDRHDLHSKTTSVSNFVMFLKYFRPVWVGILNFIISIVVHSILTFKRNANNRM